MSDRTQETISRPAGVGKLYDAQGQVLHRTSTRPDSGTDPLTDFIREQPIAAAILIFATGYIVGKIL